MNTNDALTTTAAQVETILTDHSVTYTTTDNRGKEEDDYRITVGDVTAYLTASDDGDVWATTDENPADAYDGPANVDEIALHLMNYAAEIPAPSPSSPSSLRRRRVTTRPPTGMGTGRLRTLTRRSRSTRPAIGT